MVSGLESARLKAIRAAEHLAALRFHVASYATGEPHEIVTQPDGKQKVNVTEPPPDSISIVAGEIVYQLRSALDHLAFDLVKLNSGIVQLPVDWEEHCFFPLRLNAPKKTPVYNCFAHVLPGIPERAFTFIEGAQPYNRNAAGNRLGYLAKLSNIDKHRHLNVVKARLSHNERITQGRYWYTSVQRIDDGTELDPVASHSFDGKEAVKVERSVAAEVSFDERVLGEARTLPVEHLLQLCLDVVQFDIIPKFEEFLNNPGQFG
jgi:hypothetical protein